MNAMSTPQFMITTYLESSQNNLEELRKTLFEKGVLTKDYVEDGLMLLYHKYDSPVTTELERECRSLIIDRETLKLKSYSCETPRLNKDGMEYLVTHSMSNLIINPCYEGTYLSVFFHNGKWYVSTRRCLNSQDSVFNVTEKSNPMSHYEMFEDVLQSSGYANFNEFSEKLNPENSYYFILIHHQNMLMIDYTESFGENYKRICLTTVRDSEMRELDIYADRVDFASYTNEDHIFVAEKLASVDEFAESNKVIKYNDRPTTEGIVVRVWDEQMNKYHLIKLQPTSYQFAFVLGTERNIFKGLVYLYQNGKLVEYFSQNTNTQSIKKIVNPLNTSESYDTIGTVDGAFKVCTSELFELFKMLWSIKTGKHQNKELYDLLPKEYKDIMFAIRGIYYKKKGILLSKNRETVTEADIKNAHLKINDIYNYLKTLPTETFVAFLRMRRLMLNWVKNDQINQNLAEFSNVSHFCDKVHVKLCAILTNKLHPNIMPDEIPPQKEIVLLVE